MIYFTSDLHFGHSNIIKLCNRPFASVDEMDAALTRNWNATVKRNDEVYILGDFTMKPAAEAHKYLAPLNGRKYLVRGNHDRFLNRLEEFESDFVWVKDYHVLKRDGQAFVLFHYPILEWAGFFRGAIHLHGHVHNRETSNSRLAAGSGFAFNVGVDCNDFRPISIEDILLLAELEKENPK